MKALVERFYVRALVRPGTDTQQLKALGVHIALGDLTQPQTLGPVLEGVETVITTTIGYTARRATDSLASVDDQGNKNLADAALLAGVNCFIFVSVLSADQAQSIPHFYQKFRTEQYLQSIGLPFVALRPGAFLDQLVDWNLASIRQGVLPWIMHLEAAITYIPVHEIARIAVPCLTNPNVVGQRIDLGMNQPASALELSQLLSQAMAKPVTPVLIPAGAMAELAAFFNKGYYIAQTSLQQQYFGPLLKLEQELNHLINQANAIH